LDGGLSWSIPVEVIDSYDDGTKHPVDRPWVAVNHNGSQVYVTTIPQFWIPAPNRPYLSISNDAGTSFQSWRYIDSTNFFVGSSIAQPTPFPAIAGQNTLHLVYPSYDTSQNMQPQFILATSTDHGVSFQYQSIFTGLSTLVDDSAKINYEIIADPSDSLHLAFIYGNSNSGDIDIFMRETYNGGTSWTNALRINDDAVNNGKMQDMIWADFDSDGDLAISWRDRRNGAGSGYARASEFYYAYRHHDSLNFQPNRVLTDSLVPYNTWLLNLGTDYMSMVIENDTIYATWADGRASSLDVWFVRAYAPTGTILSASLIASGNDALLQIFPNPTSDQLVVKLLNQQSIQYVRILNTSGQLVFSQAYTNNEVVLDLKNLTHGVYVLEIESNSKILTQKFIRN
ncbi:MAG: T9SS type A sorting domain-containing protein, partial [Bacteroidia bacterium]